MAGPFGFDAEKYEVAQAIGERVLLPAVRAASPEYLDCDGWVQLPRTDTAKHRPARLPSGRGAAARARNCADGFPEIGDRLAEAIESVSC